MKVLVSEAKAGGKGEKANKMEIGTKPVIHRKKRERESVHLVYRYVKKYNRSFKGKKDIKCSINQ